MPSSSGYLSGWIEGLPAAHCGRRGNACRRASSSSRHGCTPAMPTRAELEEFLGRAATPRAAGHGRAHRALHRATTRAPHGGRPLRARLRPSPPARAARGRERRRLSADRGFKALVAERARGRRRAARRGSSLGVIVDGRHGAEVLQRLTRAAALGGAAGRTARLAAARVRGDAEASGSSSCGWPRHHVVKCLVNYHPDDPHRTAPRAGSAARRAARTRPRRSSRELLIEIIARGPGRTVDAGTTPRRDARLYNLGVRPAWWKLEPQRREGVARDRDVDRGRTTRSATACCCSASTPARSRAARRFESRRAPSASVAALRSAARSSAQPARDWFAGTHRRRGGRRAHRRRLRAHDRRLAPLPPGGGGCVRGA